ncbi:MAG: ATP-binding protein [Oscillatoriales cyanobacterium C42_A2020_001]|nr:ATP-binding protein [Leptolyngbyaceae cyanobacterium C42_A2020_001]
MSASASVDGILQQAASLLVYQSVLETEVGQAFLELLQAIHRAKRAPTLKTLSCLRAYGRWFRLLAELNQSWQEYLVTQILQADNPFTRQAQRLPLEQIPAHLREAARHDLQILQRLYWCDGEQFNLWIQAVSPLPQPLVVWHSLQAESEPLQAKLSAIADWTEALELLATHYRQHGTGLFAQYHALRWYNQQFQGIPYSDPIQLSDLTGYNLQKETLVKNTEFLLRGFPALHVLLYGSRGSGKSSLVKALLNRYGNAGLRLIEVAKSELQDLPAIADQLRELPQKFIIFVDDLSFEEDEDAYKALKVVLEGNLTARPQNVVVYATSNRRHLIREFFGDRPAPRDGDEIHAWDTVQEKLSFSDRFGLTLTFEPANQVTYLQIVHHLAQQAGLSLASEELEQRALQWATRHNGRSGRTARQFVDFLQAELSTNRS